MKINYKSLKYFLDNLDFSSFPDLREYQNKFYLKKEIQLKFPSINDKILYNAIDAANIQLKQNALSKKYAAVLCRQIINQLSPIPIEKG